MDARIRKVSIAQGYLAETSVMNYVVGNTAYKDYKIASIDLNEDDKSITIMIKNSDNEMVPWKKFTKTMAATIEYSLDYDEDFSI